MRGVSAASASVAWASGSQGTVLRTSDGGATWKRLAVDGAAGLDFRDVDAIDQRIAYVLSIGSGPQSRIYKTADAGVTWTLQFTNTDPPGFYDAMSFGRSPRPGLRRFESTGALSSCLDRMNGGTSSTPCISAYLTRPALPTKVVCRERLNVLAVIEQKQGV